MSELSLEKFAGQDTLQLGHVLALLDDGIVQVLRAGQTNQVCMCQTLQTKNDGPLRLYPDDVVLLWPVPSGSGSENRAIILGRVGPSHFPAISPPVDSNAPDELTLEAKSSLTLKCGEGSITIRQDGKILIKGKNLVSLAMETNRIKGGSVAIN